MTSPNGVSDGSPGTQTPRIRHAPSYVSSAGEEAIECAARAGLELDPWQQSVLVDALGERADGKWSAFEVGIAVPRQNGKGTLLEARELAGLFVFDEKLIIHSAHEQLTSSEHFRRLLNLLEGVPEFEQRILKVVRGKGAEAIELRKGQRILFKTRTGGAGLGLTGDLIVLDEAMILPTAVTSALVPTMSARSIHGNPQLWYAGSVVDQERPSHEHGFTFSSVRQRGLDGLPRLMYVEHSADVHGWFDDHGVRFDPNRPELDQITPELLRDPEVWAQANPALGVRISHEHVRDEQDGALGAREFAVERLGIGDWFDTSADANRVIPAKTWEACAEHDPSQRIASPPIFAIDASPDQTWSAISVAGRREDDLVQVALVAHERGSGWVLEECSRLHREHRRAQFVIDVGGPAVDLIKPLQDARLRVIEAGARDYREASAAFLNAATEGVLRYPSPQPELEDALAGARKKSLGDGWKWARRDSAGPDISPLVAATFAYWFAATSRRPRPRVVNLNELVEA